MSYWEDRQRQLNKALDKDEAKLKKRLNKIYEKEAARLDKEIAQYFARYGENNVIEYRKLMEGLSDTDKVLLIEKMNEFAAKYPEYSHLMPVRESIYKLDRLQGLQYSLRMQQLTIGAEENKLIKEHLEKAAERSITAASEVMGFGTSFYTFNKDILKNFVDVPWGNGMKFSDRLWQNKEKLYNYLSTDFAQGFARGDSYQKLSVALRTRFKNVSRNDAFRLIYTEGTFVQAEASMQPFTEAFEQYRISTVGDNKVCPICSAISKEVFEIKDRVAGENFPPFHPWCRCTFIPVVEDWDEWIDNYVARHGDATQAEKVADRLAQIHAPIKARGNTRGNPAAVLQLGTELNSRQEKLLGALPDFDSRAVFEKAEVSMRDLSALTANTGNEFAMFTRGSKRLIIRGNNNSVNVNTVEAERLAAAGYKFSGHTHPGASTNVLIASDDDYEILKAFKQRRSVTYNAKGGYLTYELGESEWLGLKKKNIKSK